MHDWRTRPDAYDTYAYVIENPWPVRILYAFGLLSWFGVMYGYGIFLNLSGWYWLAFGPPIAVVSIYHVLNYGLNLFFKPFSVSRHKALVRKYWVGRETLPSVDVFLPVCGEDIGILEWTFAAVKDMDYPDKKVYVLDDKGSAETRRLAEKLGFAYLSRPNKGEMKKAGNLKFGHEHSDGEFIVVFDADFAPHKDFIGELLPYMADPSVAIVQSPQHFQNDDKVHGRSKLAYGAGHVQEDFYRIVQQARDAFGAAICVGSNAVYRRSALDEVGGTAQVQHSEDVLTGFALTEKGKRVKYVPLVLAQGLCPENVHAYFHQQHRWCSGTMQLCLSKRFLASPLTLGQKFCYLSGLLYYVSHAISLLLAFQVYVVLLFHYESITLWHALPFVPHLIFTFVALPLSRKTPHRAGTTVARAAQSFSCSHAVLSHFAGRGLEWQPTGTRKTRAAVPFVALVSFVAAYFLVQVVLVSVAIAERKFPVFRLNYYSVMFWVLYNFIASFLFLLYGRREMQGLLAGEADARSSATRRGLRFVGVCAALAFLATGAGATYAGNAAARERVPKAPIIAVVPLVTVVGETRTAHANRT